MCDCLTKTEPGKRNTTVSSSEMKRRFRVNLERKGHRINLSHLLFPTLDEASEDESFLVANECDIFVLYSHYSL